MPTITVAELVDEVTTGCSADSPHGTVRHRPAGAVPPVLREIESVIGARRSTRAFAPRAIAPETLNDIVHSAWDFAPAGTDSADDIALLAAIATTGSTIEHEIRLLDPLAPSVVGAPVARSRELAADYAGAPVLLLVCGRLEDVAQHTYGDRLVLAGELAHAAWLSAVRAGLHGCVFGRAHRHVNAAANQAQPGLRHLFTLALGYIDA